MRDDPYKTFQVGDTTVEIYPDTDPTSPEDHQDDSLFLACWSREFPTQNKSFDCLGDFSDFVHPHNLDEDDADDHVRESSEPSIKPEPRDAVWMQVYKDHAQEIEQLLLEAGEEIELTDSDAINAADHDRGNRSDVWYAWQRYKKAHAEYACFVVHVANYGGGNIALSLGDVWDGEYDKKGRWAGREPEAMVRIKRDEGWSRSVEEVAKSLVNEWNQYLSGDVWGYVIKDEEGEEVDSCWGYYGTDDCEEQARSAAAWHEEHALKQLKLPFTQPLPEANG